MFQRFVGERTHVHKLRRKLQQMHAPQGYRMSMPTSMVSIKIMDTGIGMADSFIQETIFKPFAKADPYTVGNLSITTGCVC